MSENQYINDKDFDNKVKNMDHVVDLSVFLNQVTIRHKLEEIRNSHNYKKVQDYLRYNSTREDLADLSSEVLKSDFNSKLALQRFRTLYAKLLLMVENQGDNHQTPTNISNSVEYSANDSSFTDEMKFG